MLMGREAELDVLERALARAASGQAHVVVLEGEAGIGKTELAGAVRRRAEQQSFRVAFGASEGFGWDRPFGPILSSLDIRSDSPDPAMRAASALIYAPGKRSPSILESAVPEARSRAVDVLVEVVKRAAQQQPFLLVLEDLHRSDTSTLIAVRALADRVREVPFLMLATVRPPVRDDSERLIRSLVEMCSDHIELGPLDDISALELVARLVGATPGVKLTAACRGAQGNPLLLTELARALLAEQALTIAKGQAELTATRLPESFSERVLRMIGELDEDVRGVLRLAAILGPTFGVRDLGLAADRAATDLSAPIDTAIKASVLCAAGDELAFRHELIRSVIYESVPTPVRLAVHRDVAQRLAAGGASPLRAAGHFSLGAEPGDREAISWLRRAAADMTSSAPETAIELLDRALELVVVASDRAAVRAARLEPLALCGRLVEAEDLADEIRLASFISADHPNARIQAAAVLLLRNRAGEAAALLEEAAVHSEDPSVPLAEAGLAWLTSGSPTDARKCLDRALMAAGDTSHAGRSLALAVQSRLVSFEPDLVASLTLASEAVVCADQDPTGEAHRYQTLLFKGLALHDLDRLDETMTVVDVGRRLAQQTGAVFAEPLYAGLAAFTHLRAGRLEATVEHARAGIRRSEDIGSSLAVAWCQALLALALLHLDDIDGAVDARDEARGALAQGTPLLGLDLVLLADALVDEELGDQGRAIRALDDAWTLFAELDLPPLGMVIGPDLVRLARGVKPREELDAVVLRMQTAADSAGLPSWQGIAHEVRGLLDDDADTLAQAVAFYRCSPRQLQLARCLEHAGRASAASGDVESAREQLYEASETFQGLAAVRDQARTAATLRSLGARSRRPRRGAPDPASLTGAERDIVELVARGFTNQEIADQLFVSRRTVESHLYRIFGKLGVRSRTELVLRAQSDDR
jgi:DNA-binding CsgD family transcriptional regulator/tetratricopeptide (TPR) repeat protein